MIGYQWLTAFPVLRFGRKECRSCPPLHSVNPLEAPQSFQVVNSLMDCFLDVMRCVSCKLVFESAQRLFLVIDIDHLSQGYCLGVWFGTSMQPLAAPACSLARC